MHSLSLIMALSATAAAGPLSKRIGYIMYCDQDKKPNFDDCQGCFDQINSQTGNDANYFWNAPAVPQTSIDFQCGDCHVGIGFPSHIGFTNNYVVDGIDAIEQQCQPGSTATGVGGGGTATYRDPSFEMFVSVDRFSGPSKRDDVKRDDVTWSTAFITENASPTDSWKQVDNGLPGGSTWTFEQSYESSSGVETSVSVSADFFEIFQASTSVTYSQSETSSWSWTQSIPCNCDPSEKGILNLTPKFTEYSGGFSDGSGPVSIYIPATDDNGNQKVDYRVQCVTQ